MKSKKEQLEELEKELEQHLATLNQDLEVLPSLKKQQKFVKKAKELEDKIKALKEG
ncbi:hypothetical protein [Flammeovirga sp. EKP202]|uniref:hypothetical protein n=1 Tax=Flammeovirga sp. EKP202 TaxID=2770592 RepID=UPI00165F9D5C|nr:hypothetical protein [Flammeovirga sp. EKP202]MBD0402147.1 hypothetical protein [Flammeovirga sp. EKP202]